MQPTKLLTLLLGCMLLSTTLLAQPEVVDRGKYAFLQMKKNHLNISDSLVMERLYQKFQRLMVTGDEQINIVHIGDSHLQADFFSNQVRQRLQSFFPGGNGGRGFVFPYTMARTNNPFNYKVHYTGQWSSCRNVQSRYDCALGLAGISVTTTDSVATIQLAAANNREVGYDFTHIKLFYADPAEAYEVSLDNEGAVEISAPALADRESEWEITQPTKAVNIRIRRAKPGIHSFTLYGVVLGTDDPGIVYHSIGVNGATVTAFNKCEYLEEQLSELQPDLIILSLGTNDAYVNKFQDSQFVNNYSTLLRRIQARNPETPILLTTPSDCYKGRSCNLNNLRARDAIYKLARMHGLAVWDFFEVMGGLNSIQRWYQKGLTAPDRVHLSRTGYELQGDLLFEALMEANENYIARNKRK